MIRSYFNATAEKINKYLKTDGYGQPVFETISTNIDCRKTERIKLVRDNKGNEVVSSAEVWLPPDMELLPPESEIVFNGVGRTVIDAGYISGIKDKKFLRVYLK